MSKRKICLSALFLGSLVFAAVAGAAGRLDDGLLDPAWFGQDLEFRTSGQLDYFWVKPDLSLQGKTIQVEDWPDPVFLGTKADVDSKDSARAYQLAESMPNWLRGS